MFASQVRMADTEHARFGGHADRRRRVEQAARPRAGVRGVLLVAWTRCFPADRAALYRREMLDQIGAFDESFFLYCEDVDLGLRARWAGWECRYVAGAVVEHRYSHSAGRASPLKAYYVERNRLYTAIKNFPAGMLLRAPLGGVDALLLALRFDAGRAREDRGVSQGGQSAALLPFLVLRAHVPPLVRLPRLLRERRRGVRRRSHLAARVRGIAAAAFHFHAPGGGSMSGSVMRTSC